MTIPIPISDAEARKLWRDKSISTAELATMLGLERTTAIKRYGPRGFKSGKPASLPDTPPGTRRRCPCCGEPSLLLKRPPLRLGAMEQAILNAVRDSKAGLSAKDLVPKIYNGVLGGGPATALNSIRVTIHTVNKKLAPLGLKMQCQARGGAYLLVEI